jgi:hypothetical protein
MGTPEVVSAVAAVVSAAGGAKVTQQAATAAEHRAALRQIGITATEILIEVERFASRGSGLKIAYRTLSTYAGQAGGSRQSLYDKAVDEKLKYVAELSEHAKLFANNAGKLDNSPPEETDRVQVRLSSALTEIRALREDIERELAGVEGQSATYRDKVIKGAM